MLWIVLWICDVEVMDVPEKHAKCGNILIFIGLVLESCIHWMTMHFYGLKKNVKHGQTEHVF